MRLSKHLVVLVAQLSPVLSQSSTTKYCDTATKICYASYSNSYGVSYRLALPPATSSLSDAILEMVIPVKYKWAGMSWQGQMLGNPLTVGFLNGQKITVSSREASAYAMPQAYTAASYTKLKGTIVNSTHWTLNVRCEGCTRWGSTTIDQGGSTQFAYALGTTAPASPSSNTSTFQVHDAYGYWTDDLTIARTDQTTYNSWITNNPAPVGS